MIVTDLDRCQQASFSCNFSLADAIVLNAARKLRARILTGDPDFKSIDEAVMLK